jgi:hypothetical protein
MWNASRFCVSSLRRGHANLLCIVPILEYVLPKQAHINLKISCICINYTDIFCITGFTINAKNFIETGL